MLNSLGANSLQITIKTGDAGQSSQLSNSARSSSPAGDGRQSDVAALLADVLTILLFDSQGGGNGAQSASDPNTQLMSDMLLNVLSELLEYDEALKNSENNPFGQKRPSETERSAYHQGVQDTLNALLSDGLSQTAGNQALLPAGGADLQALNGADEFSQLGNSLGLGVGQRAGLQALNDISTHNDSPTRYFVDKEDRALAKEIGQFMDQYPEKFGKPEYQKDNWTSARQDDKSWANALSKPDDDGMTKASMDKFLEAVGMVKSAIAGDGGNTNLHQRGNGGSSLGIDAALVGDSVINMGLAQLAA